jgi:3-vinyl bacteriochlorophyllide hydratase
MSMGGQHGNSRGNAPRRLYTDDQRARRDATRWTLVQGLLAPFQFLVFLISLVLVIRYLVTGDGYGIATLSVVIKTGVLYLIMVTGAIWEKVVFGQYLFAPRLLLGRRVQLCGHRPAYRLYPCPFHR